MPLQKKTKDEILQSCIRVFRRQGYYRTSMKDLAKEIGMTKGAFYHHFDSKEQIMRDALENSSSYFSHKIFKVAYEDTLPPHERLEKIAGLSFKAFTEELGGCFFANTVLETAHVEDTFLEIVKLFFSNWEKALIHIFESKHNPLNASRLAQQVISDIEGSIIMMQLHKDSIYLRNAFERARAYT